ncbi:FAD-dependent monooxygenase [Kitasatospora indigofera]|uniref:FAD-dependent monooxygenase n=1 Tax=Kitasatospora indigofera TaxID=67307 RepID=UPI003699E70B
MDETVDECVDANVGGNADAKRDADKAVAGPGPESTEVLIVGAGPTGLTLACDLARHGVRALLVERAGTLFPGSRGKGLQPRTQEVFEDLGVLDRIHAAGAPYPLMMAWENGERLGTWDLIERGTPGPATPYADVWMIPQWRTQEILYERLLELGGQVLFGTALTGLEQHPDRVEAVLTTAGGGTRTVTAGYLVGADGGRGAVRRTLGVAMHGEEVDPRPALVADLRVEGLDRDNWHVWPKAPGGALLLCPMPGTEEFQLFAQVGSGAPDTSADGVRALVAAGTHLPASAVTEVRWASDFRPRAAVAERFREGRVFLAGDAAHIHSPAGGQGLNTSVQDAYNLGWKLGRVLRAGAPESLLDSYQEERYPVAAAVIGLSTGLHRAERDGSDDRRARRGKDTDQLAVGYRGGPLTAEERHGLDEEALQAGDRAPDSPYRAADGTARRLFELYRGTHLTVLAVDRDLPVLPAGVRGLRLDGGHAADAYGPGLFVIRPDGYVGLATHDPAALPGYLAALGAR